MSRYLALAMCVGCSASPPDAPPDYGPADAATKISYSRSDYPLAPNPYTGFDLHGTDVVFTVGNPASTVTEDATVSTANVEAMITALEGVRFFELPDENTQCSADGRSSTTIKVELSIGAKTVISTTGCEPVYALGGQLSDLSGLTVWLAAH